MLWFIIPLVLLATACLARAEAGEGQPEELPYPAETIIPFMALTDAQKALLRSIDVLIDGPYIQSQRSLELNFRGSRNQRILDVKKSLSAGKAVETTSKRWLGEY